MQCMMKFCFWYCRQLSIETYFNILRTSLNNFRKVWSYLLLQCMMQFRIFFLVWSMNSCFIILIYRQVRICLSLFGIAEHDAISDFVFGIVHSHWALNLFSTFCKQVWTIMNNFDLVWCYRAWCNFGISFLYCTHI